jgi:hypothetical protein
MVWNPGNRVSVKPDYIERKVERMEAKIRKYILANPPKIVKPIPPPLPEPTPIVEAPPPEKKKPGRKKKVVVPKQPIMREEREVVVRWD